MNPRSLALTTELGLYATRSKVIDRGDYLVVETPDDPNYYYGNLLVLPAAPQVGEVAYWTRRFHDELDRPEIKHVTLWWDGITGELGAGDELRAAGFTLETNLVMVAEPSHVFAPAPPLPLRELTPAQVRDSVDLGWATGDRHDETYREFLQRRTEWHARLVERGLARFWGAHDGKELIASLGLVTLGNLARYQDVQTAVAYRKRGLASALLAIAAAHAAPEVERVVIIAAPDSEAERTYARVGFHTIERTTSACLRP